MNNPYSEAALAEAWDNGRSGEAPRGGYSTGEAFAHSQGVSARLSFQRFNIPPCPVETTPTEKLVARFNVTRPMVQGCHPTGCTACPPIADMERDCSYPSCAQPDRLDGVRFALQSLVDIATAAGVVVTLERHTDTSGHARYVFDTRVAREVYQK